MVDLLVDGGIASVEQSHGDVRERVRSLVSDRLDRLPERARDLLEALELLDGAATAAELALASGLKGGEVDAAVRRLEAADLVRSEPTASGVLVVLRSGLYREAILGRIPPDRVGSFHDAALDRLTAAGGPATVERTADLAFHAIRGTRPAIALPLVSAAARDAIGLHACDRARDLLLRACRLAASLDDEARRLEALDLLARAHERLGATDMALIVLEELASAPLATRAQVVNSRLRAAAIQLDCGRPAAAARALDAVGSDTSDLEHPLAGSLAARLRARLLVRKGGAAEALAVLERALARLSAEDAGAQALLEIAHLTAAIGEAHALLRDAQAAARSHRESLARFLRLRDASGVALAHLNLGLLARDEGRTGGALERLRRCERLARKNGHYAMLAAALRHRGAIEASTGRLADAVRTLTACVHLSRRLEDETGLCEGLSHLGWTHHLAGRHEMARILIEEVVTRRGRLNDLSGVAAARVLLGRLLAAVHALDDAEMLLRTAADAADQLALDGILGPAMYALAEVSAARGRDKEASALLGRKDGAPDRLPRDTRTAGDLLRARIALKQGDGRAARGMLARAMRDARRAGAVVTLVEGRRLAGLLREGGGALVSLRAARRLADRAGLREHAWRVRADLGRALAAAGAGDEAFETMKDAMVLLRRLHDEIPARRREAYLADPAKQALRAAFSEMVERTGVIAS
jgi:tetratricopeptide (TPR) repeat protein